MIYNSVVYTHIAQRKVPYTYVHSEIKPHIESTHCPAAFASVSVDIDPAYTAVPDC